MAHTGRVSTPSERLWADSSQWAHEPSLESFLPARPRRPVTLLETAHRIAAGEARRAAVADFLDDLRWARDDQDRCDRIREEPPTVDPHTDAYLGALAEDVAVGAGLRVPSWCREPHRFLDHLWWPSTTSALHARALVESPAAFRRRGIFVGRTTHRRV